MRLPWPFDVNAATADRLEVGMARSVRPDIRPLLVVYGGSLPAGLCPRRADPQAVTADAARRRSPLVWPWPRPVGGPPRWRRHWPVRLRAADLAPQSCPASAPRSPYRPRR